MIRTVASTTALLAAALVGLPGATAAAVGNGDGPRIVITSVNQYAGDDIFTAGRDNTVGSHNGNDSQTPVTSLPGTGTGTGAGVLRIVTGPSLPFSGVPRVSQEGSADFPRTLLPNYSFNVPVDAPSSALYSTEGDQGRLRITAAVDASGNVTPGCSTEGNLTCEVQQDAQGSFLKIESRR
ncbi:hypothetical protein AB0F07_33060 [Streptomyces fructofermentans]|uniref:hypothetical protein n=1 Tax=Streptomyces fructofermentans TaxID=152141 RepID=UPI0033EB59B9